MSTAAPTPAFAVEVHADQVYSSGGGRDLLADVFLPREAARPLPVILWLHGGGWRLGDRRLGPDFRRFFAERGFAMVSIDYRLSGEAIFPAQAVDVKAAVRWVRKTAGQFGFAADRVGLWGSSAGGHLAACAALAPPQAFRSGEYAEFSDTVQAVVDGYGPTDFSRMDEARQTVPEAATEAETDAETQTVAKKLRTGAPDSFESLLIGSPVGTSPEAVERANPVKYVHRGASPFLILHGLLDALVPWQQSELLFQALAQAGNDATLVLFEKLGHSFLNNNELDTVDYGAVTKRRSHAASGRPAGYLETRSIFGMVEGFFRDILRAG